MKKPHKKHGTVRTDLAKRKKPTVAKHAGPFRSTRVKPTAKERIMAKVSSRDYETEEAAVEAPPAPAAKEDPPPAEELLGLLELAYANGGSVNPRMIELAKGLKGA